MRKRGKPLVYPLLTQRVTKVAISFKLKKRIALAPSSTGLLNSAKCSRMQSARKGGHQQYPPHWIELLGSRIKRVHIKDFQDEFGWEGRYAFCDLLQGQVPFPETMAALRAIGYDKTIVAEMIPWRPDLLEVTSRAMDTILVPA